MTLAEYLAEYAANVVQEWMRIVSLDDDVLQGNTERQLRMQWESDKTFSLFDSPYGGGEHGRYRLIVKVEEIEVPPIGPEDDGALRAELADAERLRAPPGGTCSECIWGDEDPCAWCDCIREDSPCKAPCRQRAHAPERCPNLAPVNSVIAVRGETWVETTFLLIEPGDSIRIPGTTDTADVISVVRELWHANVKIRLMPSGKWWDETGGAWNHFEVRAALAVNGGEPTGLVQYPSDTAVEILCTPERKAQLVLARAFIGTTEVK